MTLATALAFVALGFVAGMAFSRVIFSVWIKARLSEAYDDGFDEGLGDQDETREFQETLLEIRGAVNDLRDRLGAPKP